jgi:hypothetical protein
MTYKEYANVYLEGSGTPCPPPDIPPDEPPGFPDPFVRSMHGYFKSSYWSNTNPEMCLWGAAAVVNDSDIPRKAEDLARCTYIGSSIGDFYTTSAPLLATHEYLYFHNRDIHVINSVYYYYCYITELNGITGETVTLNLPDVLNHNPGALTTGASYIEGRKVIVCDRYTDNMRVYMLDFDTQTVTIDLELPTPVGEYYFITDVTAVQSHANDIHLIVAGYYEGAAGKGIVIWHRNYTQNGSWLRYTGTRIINESWSTAGVDTGPTRYVIVQNRYFVQMVYYTEFPAIGDHPYSHTAYVFDIENPAVDIITETLTPLPNGSRFANDFTATVDDTTGLIYIAPAFYEYSSGVHLVELNIFSRTWQITHSIYDPYTNNHPVTCFIPMSSRTTAYYYDNFDGMVHLTSNNNAVSVNLNLPVGLCVVDEYSEIFSLVRGMFIWSFVISPLLDDGDGQNPLIWYFDPADHTIKEIDFYGNIIQSVEAPDPTGYFQQTLLHFGQGLMLIYSSVGESRYYFVSP